MIGVLQVVDACQGHDLLNPEVSRIRRHSKRASTLEECVDQLAAMAPDFLLSVQEQALQLAAQISPRPLVPARLSDSQPHH